MKTDKLYTTLPVDPNKGWQPTSKLTGFWSQHPVTGPHTFAVETCYRIGLSYGDVEKLMMHGPFADRADAERFACSMGNGDHSKAVEVAPYYYCESWGRVPAASVHDLDLPNTKDWAHRPAAAVVLGCDSLEVQS